MRHLLTLNDLQTEELKRILSLAGRLKQDLREGKREPLLAGYTMGLLFSKPSLRTRVSFEAGMNQLGGGSLYLGQDVGWGTRETIADFARVISRYLDVIVCRTHEHQNLEELAAHSSCSIINGLTDSAHPCQAIADVMTMREACSTARPLKLAFVGDGNNVSRSLALACAHLGIHFSLAAPRGYTLEPELFEKLKRVSPLVHFQQTQDVGEALSDASAVYTDVWSSMGFEAETAQRERDFADYQVNAAMMSLAPEDAIFLHCLPAHRGHEVTDEVIDGPQSRVIEQAENRMHAQKALLVWLLKESRNVSSRR